MEFLHKDEFKNSYKDSYDGDFPVILINDTKSIGVFITAQEINLANNMDDLEDMIVTRLQKQMTGTSV